MTFSRSKTYISLAFIIILALGTGLLDVFSEEKPFVLGLDLEGGAQLIYQADISGITDPKEAMAGVRDVIERRVNLFGVSEPRVQVVGSDRLVVELAGVKDTNKAINLIGQTPFLEFLLERDEPETTNTEVGEDGSVEIVAPKIEDLFLQTGLTGKHLKRAELSFASGQAASLTSPGVSLIFDSEGKDLFASITGANIGKRLAIFLDGGLISAPIVQDEITNGEALITGDFSLEEARTLVKRLNAGALPVPIELISQQKVGASLGQDSLSKSLRAGLIGLLLVAMFMILFYGYRGVVAVLALGVYGLVVLAVFKLIPVTLTLAGISGFILSIGMAVDANVLIFERMKEEGKLEEAFARAWPAIRDGNISTLITCAILYFFTTGLVRGFALTLGIGVLISMFSAMVITRVFMELKK